MGDLRFSDLTTLRVGGPIGRLATATTQRDLVDLATAAWRDGESWLALGGGSNLLVGDEGFEGTVVRIATRGIEVLPSGGGAEGTVRLRVQAGENWDDLVAWTVEHGYSGIEALSGIPGSVGAAPVQNIGAYGQELEATLVAVEFLDEFADEPRRMAAEELELGYRTSVLKRGLPGIVVSVELELHDTASERAVLGEALGQPIAYRQLADALGVQLGDRVSIASVREAVLALRRSKGMVLDPADADSVSAGSFFTNPIVTERIARTLPADAPRWYVEPDAPDEVVPLSDLTSQSPLDAFLAHQASVEASAHQMTDAPPAEPLVKLSAAWLIEHAGVRRGFALPGSRAAISSKHTLALTNRGGASAEEIAQLARFVQGRVQAEFGIVLHPEPVFVGVEL
ncbi:UDP-N-acetylmuramate dehydrogenase [Agromyces sp. CFH 90414]|uniref:UDP-N-acetylenolpyruvoylglucosamine reductase n=1 Tax=Agromyces agglutinans TaxID=2662258 RepID=A0A6I2F4I1_9MICO|nr:UDP-N-acetylmuramate dehydrogenase [Agromyces agglutinans]MRG59522.1 UDP-N-acetylmuramate dehydrogenase [Agromyces agglutinans]